jgi:hypothetical protein
VSEEEIVELAIKIKSQISSCTEDRHEDTCGCYGFENAFLLGYKEGNKSKKEPFQMFGDIEVMANDYFNKNYAWVKDVIAPYTPEQIKSIKNDYIKGIKLGISMKEREQREVSDELQYQNLTCLVNGFELNTYQKGLAKQEYDKLISMKQTNK